MRLSVDEVKSIRPQSFSNSAPLATSMAIGSPGPASGVAVIAAIFGLYLRSFFWTPVSPPAPPPLESVPAPSPCPAAEPCFCGPWTIAGVAVAAFAAGATLIGIAWAGCYLALGFSSGLFVARRRFWTPQKDQDSSVFAPYDGTPSSGTRPPALEDW